MDFDWIEIRGKNIIRYMEDLGGMTSAIGTGPTLRSNATAPVHATMPNTPICIWNGTDVSLESGGEYILASRAWLRL